MTQLNIGTVVRAVVGNDVTRRYHTSSVLNSRDVGGVELGVALPTRRWGDRSARQAPQRAGLSVPAGLRRGVRAIHAGLLVWVPELLATCSSRAGPRSGALPNWSVACCGLFLDTSCGLVLRSRV